MNPLSDNRVASLATAAFCVTVGLVLGSPALVLAASLFASPAIYVHYLLTVAAGFVSEPPLGHRVKRLRFGRLSGTRPVVADETVPP